LVLLLAGLITETYPLNRLVAILKVKKITNILPTAKAFVNDINQVWKVLIVLGAFVWTKV
jgi:hypothetical protein